jgi:hypothetical protein
MAALGRTEGLLDYNRIRAGESVVCGYQTMLMSDRHVFHDLLNLHGAGCGESGVTGRGGNGRAVMKMHSSDRL